MKYILFLCSLFSLTYADAMLIIGHRGACGYQPENTLISFQKALDLGVDRIELDVYVCKTGELVVHHGPGIVLKAMPGAVIGVDQSLDVGDMSFDQLRSLRVAGKAQIPTLAEVIDLIDKKISINIELKGPETAKPVVRLLKKYLKKGWQNSDFVISSFDHVQLLQFKKLLPKIQVGILFHSWNMPKDIVVMAQKHQADFIGLNFKAVTQNLVQAVHQAGFPVFVWTVNDKHTADKMRAISVDGIFSDYPDRVR